MHCHMEMHNANGMALVMKEGSATQMKPMPSELEARCKTASHSKGMTNTSILAGIISGFSLGAGFSLERVGLRVLPITIQIR